MTYASSPEPNLLRLSVSFDDDGTAELLVYIHVDRFAGTSSAWFNVSKLLDFAEHLRSYPLSAAAQAPLAGGYWDPEHKGTLLQTHISVRFYPVEYRGQLAVHVTVSSPVLPDDGPDTQFTTTARLLTSYSNLHRFSRELTHLLQSGTYGEVVLYQDRLS